MRAYRQVALVLGSVLLSSLAFGQARLGPYVVDSNGVKVGHADSQNTILVFLDGGPAEIPAGRSGFQAGSFNLYYTDGACGSSPVIDAGSSDVLFGTGRYTTNGEIWYFSAASVASTPLASARTVLTDGSITACGPYSGSLNVAPLLTFASSFTPPFNIVDVLPVSAAPGSATFNDVPISHPFFQFIEALKASGITGGCQASPPLYCPDNPVTRGQMAVFIAKALGL